MKLLFIGLIRPHLEFTVCAKYEKDKQLIEGVLRRVTKCVPGLRHLEYEERLKTLRIPSMSYAYRRICGDLIEVYKFTHSAYDSKSPLELNDQESLVELKAVLPG